MKKLLIALFAVALGVSAYAKTLAELCAEVPEYKNDASVVKARQAFFNENKADCIREFNAWKVTPNAKLTGSEISALNNAELLKTRDLVGGTYSWFGAELEVDDEVAVKLNKESFIRHNSEKYATIKANGWKVGNYELMTAERFTLAFYSDDGDYILSNPDKLEKFTKTWLEINVTRVKKLLLKCADINKAKEFCNAYERAMLLKNCTTDKIETIKLVGKFLTERLLDAKITR